MSLDPERTTAHGMWRFGATYCAAAVVVTASDSERLFVPALQLFGQSIELLLKAFLLKRGVSLAQLKRMSHGLTGLLVEARRRRLGTCVKLSNKEQQAVKLLSESYSANRLRYLVTGTVRFPPLPLIESVAKRLAGELEEYCTGFRRSVFQNVA